MEINQNKNELHLYPINDNEYIGAVHLDTRSLRNSSRTVVILDSSGSMGAATLKFVREILPLFMSKLNYATNYPIHLITFANSTAVHELTVAQLQRSPIKSSGGTYIAPAIQSLRSVLEGMDRDDASVPIRVLTISDGEISDPVPAVSETEELTKFLANSELSINSQAVRLFTSASQPDTKALSYLLQINNTTEANLCDIRSSESSEKIANQIVALFRSDSFDRYQTLQFDNSIILKCPWNSFQSIRVMLVPGWNIFWLKRVPTGSVKLGGDVIKVVEEGQLTLGMFYQLMETRLGYILNHMTILKVVATYDAKRIVNQIVSYFEEKEQIIAVKSSFPNNKIITNMLNGIANNRSNLQDSAQMAEFFRETKKEIENQRKEAERIRREAEAAERKKRDEETERIRLEAVETERKKREAEETERKKRETEETEETERKKREAEETERIRLEAEETERIRLEAEETERKKREAEETERIRLETEETERIRLEAEETERKNREAEETERIRLEAEETERKKREAEETERIRLEAEETERIRLEAEETERKKRKAEETERIRLEAEAAERIRLEAERKKRKAEETERKKRAAEETERKKREAEETERKKREAEETERKKREAEETERIRLEAEAAERIRLEAERKKRDAEETERVKREEMERTERGKPDEAEHIERKEVDKAIEAERIASDEGNRRKREVEVSDTIQTVFILDEHASGAKESQRFTEKILPTMLLKLFHETSQLVHVVTFVRHKTTVDAMTQSLLQTLDATKRIRILVLTNGHVEERQEVERFADTLVEFLTVSNYSFEMKVVRLASRGRVTKNYKLVDIDATESNEFIAKQIAEYASVRQRSSDLHTKDYVGKSRIGSFCSCYFIIFVIIFVLLTIRYIFSFSKMD